MFGSIGMPELLLIIVIALIIFGPGKVPDAGKAVGQAIRDFKRAMSEPEKLTPQQPDAQIKREGSSKPD